MPMKRAMTDWVARLRVEKRPATVSDYWWQVHWLAAAHPRTAPRDFRRRDLEHYLARRRLGGWSDSTVKQALVAMKSFFGFVSGSRSPAKDIPLPRKIKPVRTPRSLTIEQANQVLWCHDTSTLRGIRNMALMALMLDTGLRAAEVCRLKLTDVDWQARRFAVIAKGGRLRKGLLSPPTVHYLKWWLDTGRQLAKPDVQTVFVSLGGTTPGRPLTTRGLRTICIGIGRTAGLVALAPHDLRRAFAHLALRYHAPTRTLQIGGGWERLDQVEAYSREIGIEDFEPYLPVANLLGRPS
jgi:site-specific recombinase XerD